LSSIIIPPKTIVIIRKKTAIFDQYNSSLSFSLYLTLNLAEFNKCIIIRDNGKILIETVNAGISGISPSGIILSISFGISKIVPRTILREYNKSDNTPKIKNTEYPFNNMVALSYNIPNTIVITDTIMAIINIHIR
jgi:hypothetical protein